ncbi:MAG: hypothetical protein F4103_05455 [Boseongicola sp. SB0673_bin_14]|nr:hypothetical protein [Boseongicola sp. SB0667_bin_21]MYI68207.1 hypothetical protein [Boseongicola sp. SB0673_bin_14]
MTRVRREKDGIEVGHRTLHLLREMRDESRQFRDEVRERFEQLDRIETAVVGMSYFQATERGEMVAEIEGIKTRLARLEDKIGLTDAPAE